MELKELKLTELYRIPYWLNDVVMKIDNDGELKLYQIRRNKNVNYLYSIPRDDTGFVFEELISDKWEKVNLEDYEVLNVLE